MIRDIEEKNNKISIKSIREEKLDYILSKFTDTNGNFDLENFRKYLEEKDVNIIREGYSLNFLGKRAAELQSALDSTTVFVPDIEHNSKPENKDSENIYISADNLEALRHLKKSYHNKIKCIYIDPPYNTGSDGFCYTDKFKYDKDDLAKKLGIDVTEAERILNMESSKSNSHSAWLSFMYSRLLIARELLSDDGVIFISIDDNEVSNLKLLCDEVYGDEQCLGIIIQNKGNAQNDAKNIQKNHEYILSYIKQRQFIDNKEKSILSSESIGTEEVYKDENDRYYCIGSGLTTGGAGGTLNNRPNLGYSIYYNKDTKDKVALMDYDVQKARISNNVEEIYVDDKKMVKNNYIPIRPPKKGNSLGSWTWDINKFNNEKDSILITENLSVCKKIFVKESEIYIDEASGKNLADVNKEKDNIRSILNYSSSMGTRILNKLMGHKYFDNPKNLDMLKFLIKSVIGDDFIILDFFSGSGTTAQAVFELNSEDGGNRKIISVQLNDDLDVLYEKDKKQITKDQINLCEDCGYPHTLDYIGIERIKRAAKKIKDETNADIDYGFKHYTLVDKKDTLDTLEKFDSTFAVLTQEEILNEFSLESRLITFLCDDGFGLNAKYQEVDIAGYKGYLIDGFLYLLDIGFDSSQIANLIEKTDKKEIIIRKIIIFGYAFDTRSLQQLKDNAEKLGVNDNKDIMVKY